MYINVDHYKLQWFFPKPGVFGTRNFKICSHRLSMPSWPSSRYRPRVPSVTECHRLIMNHSLISPWVWLSPDCQVRLQPPNRAAWEVPSGWSRSRNRQSSVSAKRQGPRTVVGSVSGKGSSPEKSKNNKTLFGGNYSLDTVWWYVAS